MGIALGKTKLFNEKVFKAKCMFLDLERGTKYSGHDVIFSPLLIGQRLLRNSWESFRFKQNQAAALITDRRQPEALIVCSQKLFVSWPMRGSHILGHEAQF